MPDSLTPCLHLEQVGLKAAIGPRYILQNVSCKVARGDRLALVGPSGSGKTSLLRLLNRLSELSDGHIYLNGQDIRHIPVIQLRQQVTLVPQESKLLGMTVRDTLAYPLVLRGETKQTIQQRLLTWTEQLHIPTDWLDRTEMQLSVGQRQLVAIARALMIQPHVLLLDEPTSALDAGRGHNLINLLTQLATQQQLTILMANHQLDIAQQFCNRLLYLEQGRLVQETAADQTDWAELKQALIAAEAKEAEEWME
ncbi:ATP-binding cassette domain-containing protein [Oculatella sp. LEGE 06141]|uniref:ABC transporter ATP-binding protein n=1 Tax=Oculatella sp. LEGE 06141 TaxID=1828648 RepID=UPI0018827B47|nr:ATP-binding cassette domain-containing protein [Oculatella sp. LEGE 06141]MBE9178182.1 ATP-binding cassette domain-containing protein [Oculatella sp. LEGE 06141]